MRFPSLLLPLLASLIWSATGSAADLTKIDRSIVKEPAYKSKPKYCLLVFGPAAKTRIWLVLDGEVLYVDRNANGDLTEMGESQAKDKSGAWSIGEVFEKDRTAKHTNLKVRDSRGSFFIHLRTSNGLEAEVGNEVGLLRFSERTQDAPVVHLAGPLTVILRDKGRSFVTGRGTQAWFIALIGTPGLGEGASVYYHHDKFGNLNMVGEAEFPHMDLRHSSLKAKIVPDGY